MVATKKSTRGETVRNGPDMEETAFGKNLRISLAAVTVAKGLVYLSLLSLRSRKSGISDGCVAGAFEPDTGKKRGRKRAMEQETRMGQQGDNKRVSHRAVFVDPLASNDEDGGHIRVKMPRTALEEQLACSRRPVQRLGGGG